jgi:hypothetical protein
MENRENKLNRIENKLDRILRLLNHQCSLYKIIYEERYLRYLLNLAEEYEHSGGRISIEEAELLLKEINKDKKISDIEKKTIKYIYNNYNMTEPAKVKFNKIINA